MKGTRITYSLEELSWIETYSSLPRRDAYVAFIKKFGRADVSLDNLTALCKRKGWFTGRTGRFAPGSVPVNKGQKIPYHPNSASVRFKKGQLPYNTKFLGHERVTKAGYVLISIGEKNPHTGFERRYVLKHRYLWEQKNGPMPPGTRLRCLDGDRQNTDPSNWEVRLSKRPKRR